MRTSRTPVSGILLVLFFGLVVVLTVGVFLVRPWQPPVASQHGAGVDVVITYLLVTTGIIFVIGHFTLAWFVWRQSRPGAPGYRPVSRKTEWIWALVPVLIMAAISEAGVLVIGGQVWTQLYGEVPPDAIEIEIVGKQFEWLMRYPGKDGQFGKTRPELVHETRNRLGLDEEDPAATDDIIVPGALYLPVGRVAVLRLRSHDVLHSFSVAAFRSKQDLVPGVITSTRFTPTRTGEYEIACAELCGLGHYRMRGKVHVTTQVEYDQWLADQTGWFE